MHARIFLTCALALLPLAQAQSDWPAYGHDLTNQRYSTLSQINTGNVAKLISAWTFDPRPNSSAAPARGGRGARPGFGFEGTPLVVNGVMYLLTASQSLVSLDP